MRNPPEKIEHIIKEEPPRGLGKKPQSTHKPVAPKQQPVKNQGVRPKPVPLKTPTPNGCTKADCLRPDPLPHETVPREYITKSQDLLKSKCTCEAWMRALWTYADATDYPKMRTALEKLKLPKVLEQVVDVMGKVQWASDESLCQAEAGVVRAGKYERRATCPNKPATKCGTQGKIFLHPGLWTHSCGDVPMSGTSTTFRDTVLWHEGLHALFDTMDLDTALPALLGRLEERIISLATKLLVRQPPRGLDTAIPLTMCEALPECMGLQRKEGAVMTPPVPPTPQRTKVTPDLNNNGIKDGFHADAACTLKNDEFSCTHGTAIVPHLDTQYTPYGAALARFELPKDCTITATGTGWATGPVDTRVWGRLYGEAAPRFFNEQHMSFTPGDAAYVAQQAKARTIQAIIVYIDAQNNVTGSFAQFGHCDYVPLNSLVWQVDGARLDLDRVRKLAAGEKVSGQSTAAEQEVAWFVREGRKILAQHSDPAVARVALKAHLKTPPSAARLPIQWQQSIAAMLGVDLHEQAKK